ncbi:MAG: phenylalanine--tRNA ligase subunit alpha [Candidatus Nomurabacteria bacterium]|jgi:phenylalanyl-tRNA synthetase alpha chain|nr:phenylalanine--tRNA ligase subunit alpha [Candidatus Nomurabacteria bacterium]
MEIKKTRELLLTRARELEAPRDILKAPELKKLYQVLSGLPEAERPEFGRKINALRGELEKLVQVLESQVEEAAVEPIDVTAPMGVNQPKPTLMTSDNGSRHPLMTELENVVRIFNLMGFDALESRQLDDDYHMFTALNFPPNHPARDMYDAFHTEEGFIPPGHTSTMQNRILKAGKQKLESGGQIATISYGRVFRNEDQDATHEHTFYQCEGVFVSKNANFAQLTGVLLEFLQTYYDQELKYKIQPGYFPFTEPSIEFAIEKPASINGKKGEWLELVPGGMIHPNVLREAGIDPTKYRGFAWGLGIERLVMLKYGIDDIRHFESGRLRFLKEF